jgi:hypothetical protein
MLLQSILDVIVMILRVRIFDELYGYFKIILDRDLYMRSAEANPGLSSLEILKDFKKKKKQLESDNKVLEQTGKLLSLLGLIDQPVSEPAKILEQMKKLKKRIIEKYYPWTLLPPPFHKS